MIKSKNIIFFILLNICFIKKMNTFHYYQNYKAWLPNYQTWVPNYKGSSFNNLKKVNSKAQENNYESNIDEWINLAGLNKDQDSHQNKSLNGIKHNNLINMWIILNNLNSYGDPRNNNYDYKGINNRYNYIINQHPNKPWLKMNLSN